MTLDLGCLDMPRETSLGVGERGVLKGWAAEVDVAVLGSRVGAVLESVRQRGIVAADGRRREDARRQVRQIIVVCLGGGW